MTGKYIWSILRSGIIGFPDKHICNFDRYFQSTLLSKLYLSICALIITVASCFTDNVVSKLIIADLVSEIQDLVEGLI